MRHQTLEEYAVECQSRVKRVFDLQQLMTGIPSGVPPKHEHQIARGGSYCPKCGADNYYGFGFYDDDPGFCVVCLEMTSEVKDTCTEWPLPPSAPSFGDDAMDGAVSLPRREFSILYGWNDDRPQALE